MKQKQVERILEDRIDIEGMAKDFIAAGFTVPPKNKIVTVGADFLKLLRSPQRLEKLSDGWIRDHYLSALHGKDFAWAPPSLEKHINWQAAEEYAAQYGRQADIDLELSTLIDRSRRNPAIIPGAEILELKTDDYYWSKTPVAGGSGSAWFAYFCYGYVYYCFKGGNSYVRPVRVSQ